MNFYQLSVNDWLFEVENFFGNSYFEDFLEFYETWTEFQNGSIIPNKKSSKSETVNTDSFIMKSN